MRFEYGQTVQLVADVVVVDDLARRRVPVPAGSKVDVLDVDDPQTLTPRRVKVGVLTQWLTYRVTGWVDLSALAPCQDHG